MNRTFTVGIAMAVSLLLCGTALGSRIDSVANQWTKLDPLSSSDSRVDTEPLKATIPGSTESRSPRSE